MNERNATIKAKTIHIENVKIEKVHIKFYIPRNVIFNCFTPSPQQQQQRQQQLQNSFKYKCTNFMFLIEK